MQSIVSEPSPTVAKVSQASFPSNQNALVPNAGSGNVSLYLQGAGSTLSLYYAPNGDSQVFYGQNQGAPSTPLPPGISSYPSNPGFNLYWTSSTGGFKLVWGVQ